MFIHEMPSAEKLHQIFEYEPETGLLRWKMKMAVRVNPGSLVGGQDKPGHRKCVGLFGVKHYLSRIIWKMHTGQEPTGIIDHIDRNPCNNRINNLRDVSRSINSHNVTVKNNNKTGHTGIMIQASTGRYFARVRKDRVTYYGPKVATLEEALAHRAALWAKHIPGVKYNEHIL